MINAETSVSSRGQTVIPERKTLRPLLVPLFLTALGLVGLRTLVVVHEPAPPSATARGASETRSLDISAPILQQDPTPDPGIWREGAPIPVPIAEIAAGVIDGVIYTGGGFTPPGGSVGTWFGAYDSSADAWERKADLPVAVHHPGMVAADGKVWLIGGYTGRLNVSEATARVDVYDPLTDRWASMPDMPGRRGAHFAVHIDGSIYIVGGITEPGAEDEMWVHEIATGEWRVAPGPTAREHLGAAASGGKLYVVAGRGHGLGQRSSILEVYDPATGEWTALPDMPGACGGCSAAATADGRIHVTGGETSGQTYREHYVYDPAAGAWHEASSMPTARHGIAAAAVGPRFYVIGGGRQAGLDYSTLVEIWEPKPSEAGLPDLTGWAWEECWRAGLFLEVRNEGVADAGPFVIRDDVRSFEMRVAGLAAGASLELHDPAATGVRPPIRADADDQVRESDETNNVMPLAVPGCVGVVLLPILEQRRSVAGD